MEQIIIVTDKNLTNIFNIKLFDRPIKEAVEMFSNCNTGDKVILFFSPGYLSVNCYKIINNVTTFVSYKDKREYNQMFSTIKRIYKNMDKKSSFSLIVKRIISKFEYGINVRKTKKTWKCTVINPYPLTKEEFDALIYPELQEKYFIESTTKACNDFKSVGSYQQAQRGMNKISEEENWFREFYNYYD